MKRRVPKPFSKHELPTHQQDLSNSKKGTKEKNRGKSQSLSLWIAFYCVGVLVFLYVTWVRYSEKVTRKMPRSYSPIDRHEITPSAWEWPLIHIVNTRFMQEQGNLTALGRSRLALFKIFCLPTMQHQSSQHFLWIIKTDPNLDAHILQELIDCLADQPNFFLVASNVNYRINEHFPGSWRSGAEGIDLTRSPVYSGNQTLLEAAMANRNQLPVLETRLDADDGLHVQFLEQVQNQALERFNDSHAATEQKVQWLYWCARRHMEWHWQERTCEDKQDVLCQLNANFGTLAGASHSQLCITPGITVGFPVGVTDNQVPVHPHHLLAKRLQHASTEEGCGYEKAADCLIFMETFIFEAIRSRTPTSAGMANIEMNIQDEVKSTWVTYAYWNMLHESFRIRREHLQWLHGYLSEQLIDIARDNLVGQCTTGHSCKEEARQSLQGLIASRANRTTVTAPLVQEQAPVKVAP